MFEIERSRLVLPKKRTADGRFVPQEFEKEVQPHFVLFPIFFIFFPKPHVADISLNIGFANDIAPVMLLRSGDFADSAEGRRQAAVHSLSMMMMCNGEEMEVVPAPPRRDALSTTMGAADTDDWVVDYYIKGEEDSESELHAM